MHFTTPMKFFFIYLFTSIQCMKNLMHNLLNLKKKQTKRENRTNLIA